MLPGTLQLNKMWSWLSCISKPVHPSLVSVTGCYLDGSRSEEHYSIEMLKVEECGVHLRKLGKCQKITDYSSGFLWLLDKCLERSMYSVDIMGWQVHGASCREMDRWSLWVLPSFCDIHILLCSQVKGTEKTLETFPKQC